MINEIYVTHCDVNYFSRCLAMLRSIRGNGDQTKIVVFLEEVTTNLLNAVPENVSLLPKSVLEELYPTFFDRISTRPYLERLYAQTPLLVDYCFKYEECERVTYIDSDLYFLRNLSQITNQFQEQIFLTTHDFSPGLEELLVKGKYNVGIVSFLRKHPSLMTLKWWYDRCFESTSTENVKDVFGDQKYLDQFHAFGASIRELPGRSFCAAPWNIEKVILFKSKILDLESQNEIAVIHFSGLRKYQRFAILSFSFYNKLPHNSAKKLLYRPYVRQLAQIEKEIFGENKSDFRGRNIRLWMRCLMKRDFIHY